MAAAEAELRAKQLEDEEDSQNSPARESPKKHSNFSPARPSPPEVKQPPPAQSRPQPPQVSQPAPQTSRQPQPAAQVPATLAPVIQQPIADHTKHTFPTQSSPSPPAPAHISSRSGPRHSDPTPHDFAPTNGASHTTHASRISNDRHANHKDHSNNADPSARNGESSTRPVVRRSQSHALRPAIITSSHAPGPSRSNTLAPPARPHPLIRAPSILTKATPVLAPLTAPPYLSAHSAQGKFAHCEALP